MELTGKAKIEFEYWMVTDGIKTNEELSCLNHYHTPLSTFYNSPESMRYGVYVDFFDSVGIHIKIEPYLGGGPDLYYIELCWRRRSDHIDEYWQPKQDNDELYVFNTRPEARTAAIDKAKEIFNNQNNLAKE